MRGHLVLGIVQIFGGLCLIALSLKITDDLERQIAIFGIILGIASVVMGIIGTLYNLFCIIFV